VEFSFFDSRARAFEARPEDSQVDTSKRGEGTVKRTAILLTGFVTLGLSSYIVNPLRADPQQYQSQSQLQPTSANIPAAPPRTKFAVINLQQVVKGYEKWKSFEGAYKQNYDWYNAEFEKRKAQAQALKGEAAKHAPNDPELEKLQQQMRTLDREVQDLGESAKKHLAKMQDDAAVMIYREVQAAVEHYARANDIELVVHYNDAVAPADLINPMNIQRKMQTGAFMPMYITPGMDITAQITDMLNQRLHASAATPQATQR
jgi:Skp family chaperone for outer membrane proteins